MTLEEKIKAIMEGTAVIPASVTSTGVENPVNQFDQSQIEIQEPENKIDSNQGESDEDEAEQEPVVSLENPIGVDNSADDLDDDDESDEDSEKENQEESCKTDEEEKKVVESAVPELLATDANLTEEFKAKAKEIFESEVLSRVEAAKQALEEEYSAKLAIALEQIAEEQKEFIRTISEHIDSHLEQVSEQWVVENKAILESNIQVENANSLMAGLKTLFEQHNIEIPEGSRDIVQELQSKVTSLQEQLQEQSEVIQESHSKLEAFEKNEILNEMCKGLTELDQSRVRTLVEDIEYTDAESFKAKVTGLRDTVFSRQKTQELSESFIGDTQVTQRSAVMQAYLNAINGGKRK